MKATSNPFQTDTNDFCVEVEDDEANLLNTNATQVKDQNSRLLEVYKKTQSNRILLSLYKVCLFYFSSSSWS